MCNYTNPTLFCGVAHCGAEAFIFCSLQIIANNYVQIWLQSASAMSLLVCELLMIVNPCPLFSSSSQGVALQFHYWVWHTLPISNTWPTLLWRRYYLVWCRYDQRTICTIWYIVLYLLPGEANMHEMLSCLAIYTWVKCVQVIGHTMQHKSGYFLHSITQML